MGEADGGNHSATLLIVDDTPANLGVVVESLEECGFRVLVAQDGEEGLRRVEFARPDLILLDVMMPGIDGLEVCRRLKKNAATRGIPVIFMTALADTESKVAGFAAGGVDYITKPLETAEVRARIDTHLALCRMQTQLLQSEKMAAIGVLAAGVAHEINNPVAFVSSNLGSLANYVAQLLPLIEAYEAGEAALAQAAPRQWEAIARAKAATELEYIKEDILGLVEESREGLARVKRIVQDLKDFSHAGEPAWEFADLNSGLESTLNIVWNELKYKANVIKDYARLPEVECMPQELNQVFLNLLVNAAHAIPERGDIRIRTGCEGEEVWIEIADTGIGMRPDVVKRIFDPFFTTKPVGQGTGLGLSLSYATVQKHHGRIEVDSAPGRGTRFRIHLPVRQPGQEEKAEA